MSYSGAKPQEVDFSGSYSGRKKRQVTEEMFEQEVENSFLHQAEDLSNDGVVADQLSRSGRDFGEEQTADTQQRAYKIPTWCVSELHRSYNNEQSSQDDEDTNSHEWPE